VETPSFHENDLAFIVKNIGEILNRNRPSISPAARIVQQHSKYPDMRSRTIMASIMA
jgi:hypothetical protein